MDSLATRIPVLVLAGFLASTAYVARIALAGEPLKSEQIPSDAGVWPGLPGARLLAPDGPTTAPRSSLDRSAGAPVAARYDDIVALNGGSVRLCTGVLISPTMVLTARHCQSASEVRIGAVASKPAASVHVQRRIPSPSADVAVLELTTPVAVTPRAWLQKVPTNTMLGQIVGYGAISATDMATAGIRRFGYVSVDDPACNGSRPKRYGCQANTDWILPATAGGDTCPGDSGGPLLVPENGEWVLAAITSRAVLGGKALCGQGGVYVRIGALRKWLSTVLKQRE